MFFFFFFAGHPSPIRQRGLVFPFPLFFPFFLNRPCCPQSGTGPLISPSTPDPTSFFSPPPPKPPKPFFFFLCPSPPLCDRILLRGPPSRPFFLASFLTVPGARWSNFTQDPLLFFFFLFGDFVPGKLFSLRGRELAPLRCSK